MLAYIRPAMPRSSPPPPAAGPSAASGWNHAPRGLRAAAGAIDVWRADLDSVGDHVRELLCAEERARAERFAGERDGARWARAHGVLRGLLGGYLGREPAALHFHSGPHGKPALLSEPGGPPPLSFNISHSGPLALYAFSPAGEVGVDVELERRPRDELAIAARTLGPAAARRLAAVDPGHRPHEFLREWARHEAAAKCRGSGIGAERAGLPEGGEGELWLAELDVGPRAAAAVAAERPPRELRLWEWRG